MFSETQLELTKYLESGDGRRHLLEFKKKQALDDLEWALKFIQDYERKHANRV